MKVIIPTRGRSDVIGEKALRHFTARNGCRRYAMREPNGRLWDVPMVPRFAIRAANRRGDTDRVHCEVSVFDGRKSNTVRLWCQCGPGDDAEPVLTIMLEGED